MEKVFILLVAGCLGFSLGRFTAPVETQVVVEKCELDHTQDYMVACLLSDICRCALDHETLDYPGFEDLFWDWLLNQDEVDPEAFKNYVYAY